MRKLLFTSALLCMTFVLIAQKNKVSSAKSYLNSGQLRKAKEAIDIGIKHEKCKKWPKAHFIKGKVYQSIYESPIALYNQLAKSPLDTAYQSYLKAMKLDVKNKMTTAIKKQVIDMIPDFSSYAINLYNSKKYTEALNYFEKVIEIMSLEMFKDENIIDTVLIYNAGLAAFKSSNYNKAIKYFKNSLDYNFNGGKAYVSLIDAFKKAGREEESIAYLKKGVKLFPNDSWMIAELVNYHMEKGEDQEAINFLNRVIAENPDNASYYRTKGILYNKLDNISESIRAYEKAIKLDPNDYIPKYNLAVIKLNQVSKYHKDILTIMNPKEYNEKMILVYHEYINVIPYFSAVLEINSNEKNSIIALKEIYFKLKNLDKKYMNKYNEMKNKLKSL